MKNIIIVTIKTGFIAIGLFVGFLTISYIVAPSFIYQHNNKNNTATNEGSLQSTNARPDLYGNLVGGSVNESHAHAALLVFVNGKILNFSTPKYQKRDLLMDFENGDGFTLHKHARFAWLGPFFESLNMSFAQNCLTLSYGSSYCSNFNNQIAFLVNGKANDQFEHYIPKDGDRILISYGNNGDLHNQLDRLNSTKIFS
jgi:hypothetical protein